MPKPHQTWGLDVSREIIKRLTSPSNPATYFDATLVQAELVKPFHEEVLQAATNNLNSMLASIQKQRSDKVLAFISTPEGLFLVWAEKQEGSKMTITSDSDPTQQDLALGITPHLPPLQEEKK